MLHAWARAFKDVGLRNRVEDFAAETVATGSCKFAG